MILERKLLLLTTLIVLLVAPSTGAQQPDASGARAELEVVLAQRSKAIQQNDYDLIRSFLSPTFMLKTDGGRIITLAHMEQAPRLIEEKGVREHAFVIRSFKLRADTAVIEIRHSNSVKQTTADGSPREALSVVEQREEWTKTKDGWKLQLIDHIKAKRSETVLNGKKISSSSTPLGKWQVTPNAEDETILKTHGILFVYRMGDHTIVKAPLFLNDTSLARMTGGSYLKVKLAAGTHNLRSEKGEPISLLVEPGKLYFLVLKLETGFPKARGLLAVDGDSIGPTAYKFPKLLNLNPLGSDNIDDVAAIVIGN